MKSKPLALAIGGLLLTGSVAPVFAEGPHSVSANIGVVSNYVWRGVTQNGDRAAVQGGLDYAHESGFYAGTWLSSLTSDKPTYELDLYAGFGAEINPDFSYDLSLSYYTYPDGEDANFLELGGSLSYSVATVGLAYTLDGQAPSGNAFRAGDLYYYGALNFELPMDFGVGLTLGHYDFDDLGSDGDYTNWQVSLSKEAGDFGAFSLNYDDTDLDGTDAKAWVGWTKEF